MEINKTEEKTTIEMSRELYDEKVSSFLQKKYSKKIISQRGKYSFTAANENSQVNVIPYPFGKMNNPERVMLVIPEGKGELRKKLEGLLN